MGLELHMNQLSKLFLKKKKKKGTGWSSLESVHAGLRPLTIFNMCEERLTDLPVAMELKVKRKGRKEVT